MNEEEFKSRLNDRTKRYAGYALSPRTRIHVDFAEDYLATYPGQVAVETLLGLLARLDVAVSINPRAHTLPISAEKMVSRMRAANRFGTFSVATRKPEELLLFLGSDGEDELDNGLYVSGSDWNAYCGAQRPTLDAPGTDTIFGGALAAILAASRIFYSDIPAGEAPIVMNAYNWSLERVEVGRISLDTLTRKPEIWFVGAGSVGTSTAFFLALDTTTFTATVIDGDRVELENIARSPVFDIRMINEYKADMLSSWLTQKRVSVTGYNKWLHQVPGWMKREAGTPDLLVSAANEYNVRNHIESGLPPIQIYGTTGMNHQVSVIRHEPGIDPCSLCLFPNARFAATKCAMGNRPADDEETDEEKIPDSALPFLSYMAGLMAATEITKLADRTTLANRHTVTLYPHLRSKGYALSFKEDCACRRRDSALHQEVVGTMTLWPALNDAGLHIQ